jgi:heme-degrading monooxygenase HmoA
MIVSIVLRKTRINDRAEWEKRLSGLLPRVKAALEASEGFVSVQYSWGADGDGEMMQMTGWETLADCRRYVREGVAADVATMEDAVLPTAPHPDGAWVRKTFEVVE